MIKLKQLKKSFGSKEVLRGIDAEFQDGKVYGIVGENGAGKTTLFRCLAGMEIAEGKIETTYKKIKDVMGFLPTHSHFMKRITGWEYLKLYCVARGISDEDFEPKNVFNLPLNRYAEHYSTGMKKKLALMAILLQKNEVYILDEPFNGVDIQSNLLIQNIIESLKKAGKTILISSHIFSTLKENCDEIMVLREGKIEEKVLPESYGKLEKEMKERENSADIQLLLS